MIISLSWVLIFVSPSLSVDDLLLVLCEAPPDLPPLAGGEKGRELV
jgi:hypothetical protein